jgi:hypothetical protein
VRINSGVGAFDSLSGKAIGTAAPDALKTASFTVGAAETVIVCNGAGSLTATLPDPAQHPGRFLIIKTIAAQTVVSAASNVRPANSNTPGTGILAATAGAWAWLVSDGTAWVIVAS